MRKKDKDKLFNAFFSKKISRRDFLKTTFLLTGSVVLSKDIQSFKLIEENPSLSEISVVKGLDLKKMTKDAIDMIGGMKSIVKPEQKVFIKPNYISGGLDGHDPVISGEIPHPDIVSTVAEETVKAGASSVIIGEWAEIPLDINFAGEKNKEGAQIKEKINRINKKYGNKVFLLNLMVHTTYFTYINSKTSLKFLAIPNLVSEADVIISIPVLKTHHSPSPVTLGMKNLIGIMPSTIYGEPRIKLHDAGIHQIIVDIVCGIKPKLTVVSGAFGIEGDGPTLFFGGEPVDLSQRIGGFLVIAGKNPVATDATATRIITKDWEPVENDNLGTPYYVNHIYRAYKKGLGEIRKDRIIIKGENLKDVQMSWKMPSGNVYPEKPKDANADI
jgi:uncharacterized protein (DUF362 family)